MTAKDKINPQVVARIRAREAEALAAGWTPEQLWESKVWNIISGRNQTGLAATMRLGDQLGLVTENYIEIIRRSGVVHRMYHPDRIQPWEKRQA